MNQVSEALADMQAAYAGQWTQSLDGITVAPNPIQVDGERLPLRMAPPRLGEHTEQILREAGLLSDEISQLRVAGAIG